MLLPYVAAYSVGPSMKAYKLNRADLERVDMGFEDVYKFMMDVNYMTYKNQINVFMGI